MTPEEAAEYRERQKERTDKLKAKQRGGRVKDKDAWTGGLVIDLAFDELMQPAVSRQEKTEWYLAETDKWHRSGNQIDGFAAVLLSLVKSIDDKALPEDRLLRLPRAAQGEDGHHFTVTLQRLESNGMAGG
jgi:hypothetical protein